MPNTTTWLWTMDLRPRLVALRKERGLSQQPMADAVGVHVNQAKRLFQARQVAETPAAEAAKAKRTRRDRAHA
jgi:transcriptional regulator with XRE-family HTH domain